MSRVEASLTMRALRIVNNRTEKALQEVRGLEQENAPSDQVRRQTPEVFQLLQLGGRLVQREMDRLGVPKGK